MLKRVLIIFITLSFFTFCKTKKKGIESTRPLTIDEKNVAAVEKTTGVVSHIYGTCGSVVIIKSGETQVVLVPFPALDKTFDVDGQALKFTYRKLRVPVPEGCLGGTMSELKDIEKK